MQKSMPAPQAAPQAVPIVSAIHVWLAPNGSINVACEGRPLSRPEVNMLMETARQNLCERLREAEKAQAPRPPAIEIAPAGMHVERNDN